MSPSDIRILIVDDDEDMRGTLTDFIARLGVKPRAAGDVAEATRLLRMESAPFDLVLTDLKLPDGSGLDVVKAAHARNPETLVTILTGYASLDTAINAIRLGAYDYITKPFGLDEIGVQVRNMIERISLSKENARLSIRLQELYEQVHRLQGERGDMLRLQQEIGSGVHECSRKLDQLLEPRPHPAGVPRSGSIDSWVDRGAISTLFRELEKLDRLKGATPLSPPEVEERKRGLIAEFVGKL